MDSLKPAPTKIEKEVLVHAFSLMSTAKSLTELYEHHFKLVSKYVHATSRGHEAVQIAIGLLCKPQDYLSPYYRDDAMLLAIGMEPYDLMLQLLARKDDPFSGGRSYYCHPSLKLNDKPKIIHQSSATGMQAIPSTGIALGIRYKEKTKLHEWSPGEAPVVICSFGDASLTEGEVSEALQMAALKQLPILYLVQDNDWDISATANETRAMNAFEYIRGFKGIEGFTFDGSDFEISYKTIEKALETVRIERRPILLHANVPLLNHHTSGVRKEWYRDDLEDHQSRDPYPKLRSLLADYEISENVIFQIESSSQKKVNKDFEKALQASNPKPEDLYTHIYAPTPIQDEKGLRFGKEQKEVVMVDSALIAIQQLMRKHPECLLYGQDVGGRLGGVFREAATLAQEFGDERVFNTPIQEAFIVGSTVGMSAIDLKPIVEVQFADYIWPGLNQLFSEVSRSCYLSNGKWPVSMILRVPCGAYGGGGPYHSSSVESVVTQIRGIKIAYPSNGADLYGLMKAAYYDPNPVVIFEHKGLYWSKVKGTETAKTPLPDEGYIIPLGRGRLVIKATPENIQQGKAVLIVTYGMGVHWALQIITLFSGKISILDLRCLVPLDEDLLFKEVKRHHKVMVITEEPKDYSFAQSLAGKIQEKCFEYLDAPVSIIGSENVPAIPLNEILEKTALPSHEYIKEKIARLLDY
ncbi:MAG TPA: thiamine pyrophosphate-dependent enzyme [Saprospiraceae bacterium]|nr:thiamine pyrophosphate-dependent enzyme [Saprospiraceae bacterium]